MRRAEIARSLGLRLNVSRRFAARIVAELFELLADALAAGDTVDVRGFGRLSPSEWKARTVPGRDGTMKNIPARRCVKWRMGEELKRRVRESATDQ